MPNTDLSKFRVSSALKNIIGKELITDDFIAVFELVKNSFDAHAKRVDIIFENIKSTESRLIIRDDGKGMDKLDIAKKWLFVAYSAKREGTEDYRDKIQSKRIHAGAKGIGRFSCDKLGKYLTLYSKKRNEPEINKMAMNWEDFEEDPKKEFRDIPVRYSSLKNSEYTDFSHGTILEITGLRESWDRAKLLKLRHSLEKLINPFQDNDPRGFSIYLHIDEEQAEDRKKRSDNKPREIVNGQIQNTIFENLKIKTTRVKVEVSPDGNDIITTLDDRGTLIYSITEGNPYKPLLHDIVIYLYYLNQSAKLTFTKKMGVSPVEYGSVFLYKNGFRIYPFGEEGEDLLKMDRRKQQGYGRNLGTREVIGRIEINGDNDNFQETSSRDGGLIKNKNYDLLNELFIEYALRRLERFVVEVISWGKTDDLLGHNTLSSQEIKNKIFDIIKSLTKSNNVQNIEYDPKLLNILQNRSEESVSVLLRNLRVIADKSKNPLLVREVKKAKKHLVLLKKAKEEAEAEAEKAKQDAKKAEEEAEKESAAARKAEADAQEAQETVRQKTSQNLFLQSIISEDVKRVLSLHHHIGISAGTIEKYIKNMIRKISKGETLTPEVVQGTLERISYQAKMISSTVKFATKANFNLEASEINADIVDFIKEYAINVLASIVKLTDNIDIEYVQNKPGTFIMKFKPIEISIIIDNLLSNSSKAKANKFTIIVASVNKECVDIVFRDNGNGILRKNEGQIFDLGFSTTEGSGLGLYHVSKIVKDMGGEIKVNNNVNKGTEFVLRLRK